MPRDFNRMLAREERLVNDSICLAPVDFSVVIPIYNEFENIRPLANEVNAALSGNVAYELIFVNDCSTDGSIQEILNVISDTEECLRVISLPENRGQSTAVWNGVLAARAPVVGMLDGDGQNDPADLLKLYEKLIIQSDFNSLSMVSGCRVKRKDTWLKKLSSRIANSFRGWILKDNAKDTGSGIKVFDRSAFLTLPHFDHMHRFLPALFQGHGYKVVEEPVNHRPRLHGYSKYGLHDRLWVGLVDLFAVKWLLSREISIVGVREEVVAKNVH